MKKQNTEQIIYSLCVGDMQEVSEEVLERRLTKKEVAQVQESVGNYIDWFQAIENAIRDHVRDPRVNALVVVKELETKRKKR